VLGVQTPKAESTLTKLLYYFTHLVVPDWHTLALAALVIAAMLITPRINSNIPGSLLGMILASVAALAAGWQVPVIGEIPRTIVLGERLTLAAIPWGALTDLLPAAISIAALGGIESLLCGAVGATMTGKPIDSNQELIGQGIGNMLIPFFGGVPATAAIARTSVGVKSGGITRATSFVHAGVLLLSALALAPLIGHIPLAALAGVLLVTAWRMNEWESIRFFARARLKHAITGMLVTMVATVALDLTQAILIGIAISALIYLRQSAGSAAEAICNPVTNPTWTATAPSTACLPFVWAVRVALLARSDQFEKAWGVASSGGTAVAPTWAGGSFTMANIDGTADSYSTAPLSNPSKNPNDWRHYRYRVFESIIPLKNVMWGSR